MVPGPKSFACPLSLLLGKKQWVNGPKVGTHLRAWNSVCFCLATAPHAVCTRPYTRAQSQTHSHTQTHKKAFNVRRKDGEQTQPQLGTQVTLHFQFAGSGRHWHEWFLPSLNTPNVYFVCADALALLGLATVSELHYASWTHRVHPAPVARGGTMTAKQTGPSVAESVVPIYNLSTDIDMQL